MALDSTTMRLVTAAGLSEEAMWAHIGALGATPPLMLHVRPDDAQPPRQVRTVVTGSDTSSE